MGRNGQKWEKWVELCFKTHRSKFEEKQQRWRIFKLFGSFVFKMMKKRGKTRTWSEAAKIVSVLVSTRSAHVVD